MRIIMTPIISLLCLIVITTSCDKFNLSDRKYFGYLHNLINGSSEIEITLEGNVRGWNLHTGDPFGNDFKRNAIDNNKNITNKTLSLTVINTSMFELKIWTLNGVKTIAPKYSFLYFKGTLENLIINTNPVILHSTKGSEYNLILKYQFDEKNIKIEQPIPIVAEWHDAL